MRREARFQELVDDVFSYGTSQKVAFTGVDAAATATGANTEIVMVVATSACHINFGAAATANSMYIPPNYPIWLQVPGGTIIHVIQDAAGGNLNIVEVA